MLLQQESVSATLRKAAGEAAGTIHPASQGKECPALWVLPFSWPTAALGAPEWPENQESRRQELRECVEGEGAGDRDPAPEQGPAEG